MKKKQFEIFKKLIMSNLPVALREAGRVNLDKFPRVRIVIEFEAPNKAALEVRMRRPWEQQ